MPMKKKKPRRPLSEIRKEKEILEGLRNELTSTQENTENQTNETSMSFAEASRARTEELKSENEKMAQSLYAGYELSDEELAKKSARIARNLAAYKEMEERAKQNKRDLNFFTQHNLGDNTQRVAPENDRITELLGKAVQSEQKKAPESPKKETPNFYYEGTTKRRTDEDVLQRAPNNYYGSSQSTSGEPEYGDLFASMQRKLGIGMTNQETDITQGTEKRNLGGEAQETISDADREAARMLADWTNSSGRKR